VSGGPLRFDILLYSTLSLQGTSKSGKKPDFAYVGSIDTQGILVEHILEFKKDHLFVVGKASTFLVYARSSTDEKP
jgi:hypothetical protein